MDAYIQKLECTHPLLDPVTLRAIRSLQLPPGTHGLDAGCGIGKHTRMLAGEVGPQGRVLGLDIASPMLEHARKTLDGDLEPSSVAFVRGDASCLCLDESSLDWVWSANCVGYASKDPAADIRELARVVKPGGTIALLIWSSQMLLPGYPGLEARLNATGPGIAPFSPAGNPRCHPMRALHWFGQAGLIKLSARSFSSSLHAPMEPSIYQGIAALVDMRWEGAAAELSSTDAALFQELTHPDSPACILKIPEYYAYFVYTLFTGRVPLAGTPMAGI